MSVALILPQDFQPKAYLKWAIKIAAVRDQSLVVYDVRKSKNEVFEKVELKQESLADSGELEEILSTILEAETADESQAADCQLKKVRLSQPIDAILSDLLEEKAEFLILPRHRGSKSKSADFALQRELFLQAPCTTLQLCLASGDPLACSRVVVPTRGSRNTADAIRLATDLAESCDGQVEATYLQEDIDESAALVGERTIKKLIHRYADDEENRVSTRSLVCDDVISGIKQEANERANLLILGASYHSIVHRFFFSSITEQIVSSELVPTTIVIRPSAPWRSRFVAACRRVVSDIVPQLDRGRRVDLVERVHRSSRWDVDFIALILLSTLIAGLGLLQNSTAVVIGAMLVAPLMTPLLGAGLALVQGNRLLAQSSVGAVTRGFVVALAVGAVLGLLVRPEAPTPEMLARCSPRVPDLVIAFASGLAAAYANGRPNLFSALPGVAIAAALVPPIATAGICLAMGRIELAFGAGLLFLTNIVAIILGAACSLWAVGIRSAHAHSFVSSWAPRALAALVVMMAGLGIYEWISPVSLPREFRYAVAERVAQEPDSRLLEISLLRSQQGQELQLVVASPREASQQLLRALAEMAKQEFTRATDVRVETRLEQRVSAESQSEP